MCEAMHAGEIVVKYICIMSVIKSTTNTVCVSVHACVRVGMHGAVMVSRLSLGTVEYRQKKSCLRTIL